MIFDQFHLTDGTILFDDSNLLDQIHQSIIDLEIKKEKDHIKRLLEESISFLDKDLDFQTIKELFILIFQCLSDVPDQTEDFYCSIYNECQKNSNRLIFFAKIFSQSKTSFPMIKDFIVNLIDQIKTQIQNYKSNDKFFINNLEIPQQFLTDFVIDIVLISELDESSISLIYPFIFSQNSISNSKIQKLAQKVLCKNFLNAIPENVLTNKSFFNNISNEFLDFFIPKLTKPAFQAYLQLLNDSIKKRFIFYNTLFFKRIINGCIKNDYDIKANDEIYSFILNNFDGNTANPSILNYFDKYNIKSSKMTQENKNSLKNGNDIEKVSVQSFLDVNDLLSLESMFQNNFTIENTNLISQKALFNHVFLIISISEQKYSHSLSIKIKQIFEKYVDKNNVYEIIESMIFENYPTTNNGNSFLYDMIEKMNFQYKKKFNEKSEVLFKKIIDNKVLPLPSFWKIFSSDTIKKFYKEENNDITILMALKFSKKSSNRKIDSIIIKPVKNKKSQELIVDFIKNKDIDYLMKMDEDSLNFIISVLLYIDEPIKPEIKGLTKQTILPFLAVSLSYLNKENYYIILSKANEMANEIQKICEHLPKTKSILLIESVNSILSSDDFIFNFSWFSNDFIFKLFKIFINQLIGNIYVADKLILLQAIFKLSHKYTSNEQVKSLFDKNITKIINFIIKNRSQLENIDSLISIGLDLNMFKLKQTSSIFIGTIENSTDYDEVVNTVWFINNIYTNCRKFKKTINLKNIFNFFNEAIKKEKWDDFDNLNQFINQNGLENKQPFYSKFNTINMKKMITKILADQNPEKNDFFFELLFKILMNDSSIAVNFFIVLFEKSSNGHKICLKSLLEHNKKLYENYDSYFMNAFRNIFEYNSDYFIRKASFNSIQYSFSSFSVSTVSMLLAESSKESCSYQAFFCLKNIASTFPFLFSNISHKIFESVLPAFEFFILLFNNENMNLDKTYIRNLKVAISAFDFLYRVLYSIKVLDSFVPWIYQKITSFTISQILAFTYILNSLFKTEKVNLVMVALSSKYNLPNIVRIMLEKEVQENIFSYYKSNIYNILTSYYQTLNKLRSTKDLIYVDELKNKSNPFLYLFNKYATIYPYKLSPINYPIPCNFEITQYAEDISKNRHFWLEYESIETIDCDFISNFMAKFNNNGTSSKNKKQDLCSLKIPDINSIKQIRLCANQPNWIYKYMVNNNVFEILGDHYNALQKVVRKLNLQNSIDDEEMKLKYNEVDVDYFFSTDFNQIELFTLLIQKLFLNEDTILISLIKSILENRTGFQTICDIICQNQFLIGCTKLMEIIKSVKITEYPNFVNNKISNSLIELGLSPELRNDNSFLSWLSDILDNCIELPGRAIHLICFLIIDQPYNSKIANLCKKIKSSNREILLKNITDFISSKKTRNKIMLYSIFNDIIDKMNNSQVTIEFQKAISIIDDAIEEYNYYFKPQCMINVICYLFNMIAPIRIDNIINIEKEESFDNEKSMLKSAHPDLISTNPAFWNFYNKHLKFLNDNLIDNNNYLQKMQFLEIYPELYSFKKRLYDFRSKIKGKINCNEKLNIKIDRSNILPYSFSFLKNKTREEWLRQININYNGEKGIDEGGLTKDWFSSIMKEIFNPNNGLFVLTEKNNSMPNHLSGINPQHIEFFKFTGKLVARAILQGYYVNAHFTLFYRIMGLKS